MFPLPNVRRVAGKLRGALGDKVDAPEFMPNVPSFILYCRSAFMTEKVPQTFENHSKLDGVFHFVIFPVLALNAAHAISLLFEGPSFASGLQAAVGIALILLMFKTRLFSLRVQDRLIRLEERLRIAPLISEGERSSILDGLSESQLVALRFASTNEVAALARRAVLEKLSKKNIKQAIATWRPDYFRV